MSGMNVLSRRWVLPIGVAMALLAGSAVAADSVAGSGADIAATADQPPVAADASVSGAAEPAEPAEKKKAPRKPKPKPDLVMKGDGRCTGCHDEDDDYPVLAIGATRHGVATDERTPTCVSCHGESEQHLTVPKGSGGERPTVDFPFGKKVSRNVAGHNATCIECHQGDKLTLWMGSAHSRRDVACSQCHKLHTANDQALSRATVADMCMNCHTEKLALIKRPSRHPTLEGKVVCTDCHAAHGSAGPKLMLKDSVVETCYTCHMEKRGPFLWNHLPVTQDCAICHNPHGSVNPSLLKLRPPFLCQQCHEPTSHRGVLPSLASGSSVPAAARSCLNCHTNIHGGNNPTNAVNSGSRLRR